MSSENIKLYGTNVLNVATDYSDVSKRVAEILDFKSSGITSTIINGVILEEFQDRNESSLDIIIQNLADSVASKKLLDHDIINDRYEYIKALSSTERNEIHGLDKFEEPIMIDVGRGNVQIYTAIKLLQEYSTKNLDSDPLLLKIYNNSYDQLVVDLQKDSSATTVKFAGLMIKEASDWASTHVTGWSELSTSEKEGFASFYYNVGQDTMNERYNSAIILSGEYKPDLANTKIAQEYIINKSEIINAESKISNGEVVEFAERQNEFEIDGWFYVGGSYDAWFSTKPNPEVGEFDWSGIASQDKTIELNQIKQDRIEYNKNIDELNTESGFTLGYYENIQSIINNTVSDLDNIGFDLSNYMNTDLSSLIELQNQEINSFGYESLNQNDLFDTTPSIDLEGIESIINNLSSIDKIDSDSSITTDTLTDKTELKLEVEKIIENPDLQNFDSINNHIDSLFNNTSLLMDF